MVLFWVPFVFRYPAHVALIDHTDNYILEFREVDRIAEHIKDTVDFPVVHCDVLLKDDFLYS